MERKGRLAAWSAVFAGTAPVNRGFRRGRFRTGATSKADDAGGGDSSTNFGVLRLRRDLLRNSGVGLIATNRSAGQAAPASAQSYGMDGTFRFFNSVDVNAYWAQTPTSGLVNPKASYRTQLDYNADRYGLQLDHVLVERGFNRKVGFVRRDDIRRSYAAARFGPGRARPGPSAGTPGTRGVPTSKKR